MATAEPKDPFRAYNFRLVIADGSEARFMKCSGMEITVATIDYRESGSGQLVRRLPGRVEYSPVVLHYGLTESSTLWDWFMASVNGRVKRQNVTVQLLDTSGAQVVTVWDLIGAWPSQWKGAELDAMNNSIAIETLTLTFDYMTKKPGETSA
jgi:conserved hypothetical phage tail region protein